MRTAPIAAGVFAIAALAAAPAFAQRGHQPTTPHATAPTHTTTATHGSSHATAPTQTTTHGSSHATTPTHTTTSTTTHGNGHATARTTRTTTTTTSTTTTTTPATNPIATRISRNPQLANRLTRMLPEGMTLATASNGFRNQGQFIAALHVSQNLGIPFADLKAAMTGEHAVSLGQAIHTLRPSANAENAVTRANRQTQADIH